MQDLQTQSNNINVVSIYSTPVIPDGLFDYSKNYISHSFTNSNVSKVNKKEIKKALKSPLILYEYLEMKKGLKLQKFEHTNTK